MALNRKKALRELAAGGPLMQDMSAGQLADDVLGAIGRKEGKPHLVPIEKIILDEAIQVRVGGLQEEHLATLINVLQNGGGIKQPIVIYRAGDGYLLADGYHRMEAFRRVGVGLIMAEVREGTREDALEYAEEANLLHGLGLSHADKKNILIRRFERGHEWAQLSNRELARQLGVDPKTISNWIKEATGENSPVARDEVVGADGRIYHTEAIVAANRERGQEPGGVGGSIQEDRAQIEDRKRQLREYIADLTLDPADRLALEKAQAELDTLERSGNLYVAMRESAREQGTVHPREEEFEFGRTWRALNGQRFLGQPENSLIVYQVREMTHDRLTKLFGRDREGRIVFCQSLSGRSWHILGRGQYHNDWSDPWLKTYEANYPTPFTPAEMAEAEEQVSENQAAGAVEYVEPEELERRIQEEALTAKIKRAHDEEGRELPDWLRQMLTQCAYMERAHPASMSAERLADIETALVEVEERIEIYLERIGDEWLRRDSGAENG